MVVKLGSLKSMHCREITFAEQVIDGGGITIPNGLHPSPSLPREGLKPEQVGYLFGVERLVHIQ
jgi:hypothetical protein